MKIAQVCFLLDRSNGVGEKRYSYFTDIEDLDRQEVVVVETRYGIRTAVFMTYVDADSVAAEKASAWIVQKVDLAGIEEKKAKQKKLQEIKVKLSERKAKLEERQIFEFMAQSDTQMANLLKEYDELLG